MRPATLVLTQQELARLLDLRTAIRTTRAAFCELAWGRAVMPPKLYLPLGRGSDFRAMPAALRHPPACGVKWVNVHPRNRARGLPTVMAVIVLNDPATGVPVAVMDGLLITRLRTAAAGAVAAQALARRDSSVVGLIGCGGQAEAQLTALAEVLRLGRVKVWGYLAGEAQRFCERMRRLVSRSDARLGRLAQAAFEPCAGVARCVRDADVVVTVTPSRRPLIRRAWLSPGVHINAIGADAPGKQELEPAILREATVVVDDVEQAIHGGELNVPIRRRQYRASQIHATLGDVLIGRRPGRRVRGDVTVFDSTGLAVHDVALAHEAVRRARRQGLGRRVALWTPDP
jgi:alanine dehydrogenase